MSYHITQGLKDYIFGYKNGYVYEKRNGVFVRDENENKKEKDVDRTRYRKRIVSRLTNDYQPKDRELILQDNEIGDDDIRKEIEVWSDWLKTKLETRITLEHKETVEEYRLEEKRFLDENYLTKLPTLCGKQITYEDGIYLITAFPASNKTGSLASIGDAPQLHIVPFNLLQEQTIKRLSGNKIIGHRTDDKKKVKPSTDLCAIENLAISLRSLIRIGFRNSLDRQFLVLDEFPITLQQTLWDKLDDPDYTEQILHREIRKTPVVLRLGGAIDTYELSFWQQFGRPIHIIEYKYDVGEGRTVYRCETETERKKSQIAEYENGNRNQLIMLEEGRRGCEKEADWWKVWAKDNNEDLTVEYISSECLDPTKTPPKRIEELKEVLKTIANPKKQMRRGFFLILSPVGAVGYDIRNEFDITAMSAKTTDKILTSSLIVQSVLRDRDTKKIYLHINKGGLKNGRQNEELSIDMSGFFDRRYKNQRTLDRDGNPTYKNSDWMIRDKWYGKKDDASRNSRYSETFTDLEEMGFDVEETPYRDRPTIKVKTEIRSWEDKVLSAEVPVMAPISILDTHQREKHLMALALDKHSSELTREDIKLWDRGKYHDNLKMSELLNKDTGELNYLLGTTNAPAQTASIEIVLELKKLLEFIRLFNNPDREDKEDMNKDIYRLPNSLLLESRVWKAITDKRDLINKAMLTLNWKNLQLEINDQQPVFWVYQLLLKFAISTDVEARTESKNELNRMRKKPLETLCKKRWKDYEQWKQTTDMGKPTKQAFGTYWFLNKQELLRDRGELTNIFDNFLFWNEENDCLDNWDKLNLIVKNRNGHYLNWCDPQNNTLNRSAN